MNNLDTWKHLQENKYFHNHKHYSSFQLEIENLDFINVIENKVMTEIGCGYGRETYYFTKYAKKVYAIDVSQKILGLTKQYIQRYGDINNVDFVLAENYQTIITENVDYVYSKHVFQHIYPILAKEYIDFFEKKLSKDGILDILFRIGNHKKYPIGLEPIVEYQKSEIIELFKKYNIVNIEKDENEKYKLWRVFAKPRRNANDS